MASTGGATSQDGQENVTAIALQELVESVREYKKRDNSRKYKRECIARYHDFMLECAWRYVETRRTTPLPPPMNRLFEFGEWYIEVKESSYAHMVKALEKSRKYASKSPGELADIDEKYLAGVREAPLRAVLGYAPYESYND